MNSPARNIELEPVLIVTRKVLVQTADRFMANAVGVYTQDEVFDAVAEMASAANTKTLVNEVAWAVTREVIKRRTTPHLASNNDWIGYGDVAITLPERKIVNIYHADIPALDHRKNNVIENFNRVQQAMELDLARIDKLKSTMLKMAVKTAGPALNVLAALDA